MEIFKKLFNKGPKIYDFVIVEYESDGDAVVCISSSDGINYILDLDWDDGVMDIEFGVEGLSLHDTTNLHVQYQLLNTISHITKKIAKKCGMKFHTVVYKSSHWRNGNIDTVSSDIRDRFFSRYVIKEYPNATVETGDKNSIIIKLNNL